MVLPGGSDITTVSTGDAANARRCRPVTPQQGGKSVITGPRRKEGRKEGVLGRLEGRRRSSETRRLTFDSTHRKYSIESASAWMPSSPCHLFCFVTFFFFKHDLGDRAVCHRERRGGGAPPSSFLHTTESASRANCSSPLPKNIKTDLYIYTALYTLFFFTIVNHKSIEK